MPKDAAMRESIQVTYEGTPVDAGLMDVRQLAPALLSIGELFRDANRLLNGVDSEVAVRVKADFKKGSFKIDLDLVRTIIEQARDLLSGKGVGLDTLIELIFGAGGVIAVLKYLKGEKEPVTTSIEGDKVKLEVRGRNNHVVVNQNVLPLVRDLKIRESVDGIIRPLTDDGMKAFSVKRGKKTLQKVKSAEAKYLLEDTVGVTDLPRSEENTRTAYLEIIKLVFKEDNQWSFSDGSGTFSASVEDPEFLKKVDRHEMFGKGDQLKVLLKTTTTKLPTGKYKAKHNIVQVLDIIRSRQQDMFKKKT